MTYKEICESWIRHIVPDLKDDGAVTERAVEFFESSRDGGVDHVFEAYATLISAGVMAAPEKPVHPVLGDLRWHEGKIYFWMGESWATASRSAFDADLGT